MIGWLRTRVHKQLIIALYFESETVLKFYNLEASRYNSQIISLFVCFVALRPKSTAMVMAGRSVHLTTLFPGQA